MATVSKFLTVAVGVAAVCALAACSGTEQGTASPPASPGSSPGSAVPTVAHPLPASLIQGDPCAVLTPAQISSLFTGSPKRDQAAKDTGVAKSCSWHDPDRGSQATIQLVYAWKHGLADVYAKRGAGFFKELSPVQGYPAVAYGESDLRPKGICNVAVGIADNAAFDAGVAVASSTVGTADPCENAQKVANSAIMTLKGDA